MRTYHIPIFVPHKGCPHDCVFCNQRHITGHDEDVGAEDVKRIIDSYLPTLKKDSYIEAAFFGGSFTGIDTEKQTELLDAAYEYVTEGKIHGIRCSTRPDYINTEILDNLKGHKTTCIELGVQSTDSEVLKLSGRGHSFDDVIKSSELIKKYGINLGLQMMLGLPGDTYDKMIHTAHDLLELRPSCVRIYPTLVVENTALRRMYDDRHYTPLTIEETTEILSEIIPLFEREGIDVIRVGLQTTDDINENTVRGPYHPAIRELAEGRIIRNLILEHIDRDNPCVSAPPQRISQVYGHKRCNTLFFERKHSITLNIKEDQALDKNKLKISDKIVAIY